MKKLLSILCLFGALCGVSQAQQAKAPRTLTVDLEATIREYQKTKDRSATLEAERARYSGSVEAKQRSYEALVEEIKKLDAETKNPTLSAQGIANVKATLENKYREANAARADVERTLTDARSLLETRQRTLIQEVVEDIRPVVNTIAKERSAELVLNSSGGTMPVLFVDPSLDITAEVVKRLNAGYVVVPGTGTPSAAAPAAAAPAAPAAAAPAAAPAPATGALTPTR